MISIKGFFISCSVAVLSISALQAQLFTTDVIVQGSLCVGMDCVNGEIFGFATIKLKENNTQIRFEDTSTGTFPATDWTIGANETDNGGKNLFFIDDATLGRRIVTVEGGAPNHSLYIDPTGRIGLKTPTPVVELHMRDGDSPTIRLEQDGSAGFASQTWDIVGNETNFFVRDVNTGNLPFRISPGAPLNSLFIHPSGSVSLGTATENGKLYVDGSLVVNGDITALSDKRIKTNITDLDYGLPAIMKISSKKYEYLQDSNYVLNLAKGLQLGLIAQDVQAIIPELVHNDFQVADVEGQISYMKSINYIGLIPVLIKAMQEQQFLIEKKNEEITEIKSELAALNQRFDQIVKKLGTDYNSAPPVSESRADTDAPDIQESPTIPESPAPKKSELNNGRKNN